MKRATHRISDSTKILRQPAKSGNIIASRAGARTALVVVVGGTGADRPFAIGAAIYPVVFAAARQ
jgi:hypothetical protein